MADTASHLVKAEVDLIADAVYLRLSTDKVNRTEVVNENILVDLSEFNVVVGIEVLGLNTTIPLEEISRKFHVLSAVADTIASLGPSISDVWRVGSTNDSISRTTPQLQLNRAQHADA